MEYVELLREACLTILASLDEQAITEAVNYNLCGNHGTKLANMSLGRGQKSKAESDRSLATYIEKVYGNKISHEEKQRLLEKLRNS